MSKHETKFQIIKDHNVPQIRIDKKRANEKITFLAMSRVYCKGNDHKNREDYIGSNKLPAELQEKADLYSKKYPSWKHLELCPQCFEMVTRSEKHTSRCPHMAYKSFCHLCPRPCYPQKHIDEIRPMMRYSGPRLMLHHPIITYKHLRGIAASKKLQKSQGEANV